MGIVVAAATLIAISDWFYDYSPDAFVQWLSTLIGTIIGASLAAGFGIWLFYYQGRVSEEKRVEELRESLIAELYATRDRLGVSEVQIVDDPTGHGPDVAVVFAHLEPIVCEEAIRSALFGYRNTRSLTYLARLMREYTKEADLLHARLNNPQVFDPTMRQQMYDQAKNVKGLQQFVVLFCTTVLEGFQYQGLELPPDEKYFSDPSRQAPEGFLRYDR